MLLKFSVCSDCMNFVARADLRLCSRNHRRRRYCRSIESSCSLLCSPTGGNSFAKLDLAVGDELYLVESLLSYLGSPSRSVSRSGRHWDCLAGPQRPLCSSSTADDVAVDGRQSSCWEPGPDCNSTCSASETTKG